jgi:hypothetical protein
MDKEKYYKYMLILGALYNWLNSIIFFISSVAIPDMFPIFGVAVPISNVFLHLALMLIGVFGIGYLMVAMNLKENHGILVMGAIGKMGVFIIFLTYMILGDVNVLVFLLGTIDLLFVCLFIEFLLKYEK